MNYGFVEFENKASAEQALRDMNGRKIFNYVSGITVNTRATGPNVYDLKEIKLNWAQQNVPQVQKEDTSEHFHVFVGDLAREVTDDMLTKAFANFGTMS